MVDKSNVTDVIKHCVGAGVDKAVCKKECVGLVSDFEQLWNTFEDEDVDYFASKEALQRLAPNLKRKGSELDEPESQRMKTEDEFILTERPGPALQWITNSPQVDEKEKNGLEIYARAVKKGEVGVKYRRYGLGRFYPQTGASCTSQSKSVRSTLFGNDHLDVDLVNCHPRILFKIIRELGITKCVHLKRYVECRDEVFVQEKLPKRLAKKLVACTLYGGSLNCFRRENQFNEDLSEWWMGFVNEIHSLIPSVVQKAPKQLMEQINAYLSSEEYLNRRKARGKTGKIHDGHRLSQLLQKEETDVVLSAMEELRKKGVRVSGYQYDGFLVDKKQIGAVEEWMKQFNSPDFEFAFKDFAEPIPKPEFRVYDPMDVPRWDKNCDPNVVQQNIKRYMEQYLIKVPNGVIFLPHGPASSNQDPMTWKAIHLHFHNVKVPVKRKENIEAIDFIVWWKSRRDMRQFEGISFAPPPLLQLHRTYNTWMGFKIEEVPSTKLDINDFISHCDRIMEGQWGDFLLDLLAHRIQRPGERTGLGLVVLGPQGCGKTTFFQLFCEHLLHPQNFLITEKAEQITGKFHLLGEKIFVLWEEAEGGDTHSAAERIKHLITTESEWSEKKCKDAVRNPMCFLPIITANSIGKKSVKIDQDDRRYVVVRMGANDDPEYFSRLYGNMTNPHYMRSVFDFLQKRDISKYRNGNDWKRARPISKTFAELKEACLPLVDAWLNHVADRILEDRLDNLLKDVRDGNEIPPAELYDEYKKWLEETGCKEFNVTSQSFLLQLGTREDKVVRVKNSRGLHRYKFNMKAFIEARKSDEKCPGEK